MAVQDPTLPKTCPHCGAKDSVKIWVHNEREVYGLANFMGASGGTYPAGWRAARCDACEAVTFYYQPQKKRS